MTELCPSCGKLTSTLDDYTGWCSKCSSKNPYIKLESFLARHANHIEHYISKGVPLTTAVQQVSSDSRPFCLCCGVVIKRAPKNAVFCTKNKKCRSARDRYNYLVKKGMTKPLALVKVLSEISTPINKAA